MSRRDRITSRAQSVDCHFLAWIILPGTAFWRSMEQLIFRSADRAFLDPDRIDASKPGDAMACVIPFGLEESVTYGHGTKDGPEAIIRASHALELFDEELWCAPHETFGVATLDCGTVEPGLGPALDQLAGLVGAVLGQNKFPLILGGEHAITPAAIRPFAEIHDEIVVVQFDAHTDLRDGYLGEKFSHASAMRRVLDFDNTSIVSFGPRSLSSEDARIFEQYSDRISIHWARDKDNWPIGEIMDRINGRPVYLTFDVDAFDPSLVPATGTPEPGGLFWDETCRVLRAVAQAGRVVGADVVELAPISGLHAADFTVARLAYKILSYALLPDEKV